MLEIIHQNNLPLDRIVTVEIMATPTIHANFPSMVEFKEKADKIIKERYGIDVEHIHSPYSYEEYFYSKGSKGKYEGIIHGFPMTDKRKAWCNKRLKIEPLQHVQKDGIWYLGIAADEPERFNDLNEFRIAPLVQYDITEKEAMEIAKSLDLVAPTYLTAERDGCWFCPKQPLNQLRLLRKNSPEYWKLMLKWDNDSPVSLRPGEITVHKLDKRFRLEDEGKVPMDRKFRWSMLDEN